MFESFGYKHGIPGDADFVFDVQPPQSLLAQALRHLTGRDPCGGVSSRGAQCARHDRRSHRVPAQPVVEFAPANRSYLTIAIGCC